MHPIEISESAGIRNLHFGSDWVQGAMRICRPHALVLEYTQVMMASLLLRDAGEQFKRWPRRALLIGLGAGSLAMGMGDGPDLLVAGAVVSSNERAGVLPGDLLPLVDLGLHNAKLVVEV